MRKSLCIVLLGLVTATASWTPSEGQTRIPGWNRVRSAIPDILEQLQQAVEEDHCEYAAGR